MNQVLLALVAGLGFIGASLLGLLGVHVSSRVRLASVALAAGILLAITISDLIPDAFEMTGRHRTAFGFVIGFLALFVMEAISKAHVHHHEEDDEHLHDHSLAHHHTARSFLLGLSFHNLADGLAIGATTGLSKAVAGAVTTGVLVHQLPVGISFAAVLGALHARRDMTVRSAIIAGMMIPLGALVIVLVPDPSQQVLGFLVAIAAGVLSYVASGHLLPEAQSERHTVVAPVFAITLVAATAWFTLVATG